MTDLRTLTREIQQQEVVLRAGGSEAGKIRQRELGRLTVRTRLAELLDAGESFWELGLWAAWQMYPEWGDVPAAGVVTGIGRVAGRPVMIVANDASVKAGAFFPKRSRKVLRAQRVAQWFRLPLLYLVDSAGVFLPCQDEIFPDEDDFGRIFRNNAVLSAMGIPQYAAVMGNCIAGGAYLPVLCDKLVMTDGSQMCLAGQSLVKAAIGQEADPEQLGGARMHAEVSGTVDFREPNDRACLARLRSLMDLLPAAWERRQATEDEGSAERAADDVYDLVSADGSGSYEVRDLLRTLVDAGSMQETKAEFGPTLVTTTAKIARHAVGIVANQRRRCTTASGELQIGGVLYRDSVDKAARFVMDCNQVGLPLVFLQDVQGFMVGIDAEQSGIIRSGAKLVSAVSNSVVPKFTVVVGGSFGAGNYALCGKAYDPWLVLAWPCARYAVMGSAIAAATLTDLKIRDAQRRGELLSEEARAKLHSEIAARYEGQTDIRYGAARGWVDAIIAPHETRDWLAAALSCIPNPRPTGIFHTGVFQV